jgi:[acyl-carrier-protein] S-malonyltransferase
VSVGVLFPGQGSQQLGMGADVFDARPDLLGEPADEVLGWSLRSVCLDGPESELGRTDRAQPALYAVSFALWAELASQAPQAPAAAAGHSLGEYTALAASGAVSFFEGLGLVAARGRAMARAAALEPSGMAALIGVDEEAAEAMAASRRATGGRLWVANVNAPGQVVLAGGEDDIAWALGHGSEHGVRRVVPLQVAGAFHSPFMEPATADLAAAIEPVSFGPPAFPVWANATAAPHDRGVAALLMRQLTGRVRFLETLLGMADAGVTTFIHVGPGDVTAGLARRSVGGAATLVVSSLSDVESAAAALRGAT